MARAGHDVSQPSQFRGGDWKQILGRVKGEVSRDNLSVVAAGVAFYAFLAVFPAIVAAVSIFGMVADPQQLQQMLTTLSGVLPGQAREVLQSQLQNVISSSSASLGVGAIVGILVALWSATKGTRALIEAMNIAYEEQESRGFFRLNGVALLLTFGGILASLVALGLILSVPALLTQFGLPDWVVTVVNWLRWPLLALAVILALAVLYRYGPDRRSAQWQWLSVGSVVAGLLWLIASGLFSWYVANFGSYNETYGSIGAIVILLTWFLLSAYAVLIGAELNSEMERQTARDTTTDPEKPRGKRGATVADTKADEKS